MPRIRSLGELALEYIDKYPNHPTLTIAKTLHKDHPNIFKNPEHARNTVRYYRGNHGSKNRKAAVKTSPNTIRKNRKAGWKHPIPPSLSAHWDHKEYNYKKTVIMSDLHIPFHDIKPIEAVVKFARKYKPDLLLFNGDIHDCYALSRWIKNPKFRDFPEELEILKQFFEYIKERLSCDIVWKMGNHEKRYETYMFTRAPDLVGTGNWEYKNLVDCDNFGIEVVGNEQIIKLGKLPIVHGHEFARAMTSPVNPSRGLFLRGIHTALTSHWHRTSDHVEQTMMGKTITCWSTGALCDLHPEFARINKWNQGFATVELGRDGIFSVKNYRISDGKIL